MACFCTGRCRLPPFTCNGGPPPWPTMPGYDPFPERSIGAPPWFQPPPSIPDKLIEALFRKPRVRVKAGREVIADV